MPSELSGTQFLDALLAGPGPPIPQHAGGPGEDAGDQAAPVPEGNQPQEDVEPTEHNVATMLAVAQADLEAQFLSDTPDSEYVFIPFQLVTPTNNCLAPLKLCSPGLSSSIARNKRTRWYPKMWDGAL